MVGLLHFMNFEVFLVVVPVSPPSQVPRSEELRGAWSYVSSETRFELGTGKAGAGTLVQLVDIIIILLVAITKCGSPFLHLGVF